MLSTVGDFESSKDLVRRCPTRLAELDGIDLGTELDEMECCCKDICGTPPLPNGRNSSLNVLRSGIRGEKTPSSLYAQDTNQFVDAAMVDTIHFMTPIHGLKNVKYIRSPTKIAAPFL
jgi:hypothetical protein